MKRLFNRLKYLDKIFYQRSYITVLTDVSNAIKKLLEKISFHKHFNLLNHIFSYQIIFSGQINLFALKDEIRKFVQHHLRAQYLGFIIFGIQTFLNWLYLYQLIIYHLCKMANCFALFTRSTLAIVSYFVAEVVIPDLVIPESKKNLSGSILSRNRISLLVT